MKTYQKFVVAFAWMFALPIVVAACNVAFLKKADVTIQRAEGTIEKAVVTGCKFAPVVQTDLNTVLEFVPPDATAESIKAGVKVGEKVVDAICAKLEALEQAKQAGQPGFFQRLDRAVKDTTSIKQGQ